MIIILIMKAIACADLVWVATALLSREQPQRAGFTHEEIHRKVHEIEPQHGFTDSAVRSHISSHCVANRNPDPGKHRKLYRNEDGTYRLFRPGDKYNSERRDGKLLPKGEKLPAKYRDLIDWYESSIRATEHTSPENDPILALRGLGKDVWKSLGGGEEFIRKLRENWYGPARVETETPKRRKAG
jgi:hypothetical protein